MSKGALFLLLLMPAVFSQIVVTIKPATTEKPLYENEIASYIVSIKNMSSQPLNKVLIELECEGPLAIASGFEEKSSTLFSAGLIMPYEEKSFVASIKPLVFKGSKTKARLIAYYGIGTTKEGFVGRFIEIKKPPLEITTSLKSFGMDVGSTNKLIVNIRNVSGEPVNNIKLFIEVPEGFESSKQSYEVPVLDSGGAIKHLFEFRSINATEGRKTILLVVEFLDSSGKHRIERIVTVNVQKKFFTTLAFLGVLAILTITYLFLRSRSKKGSVKEKKIEEKKTAQVEKKEEMKTAIEEIEVKK